MRRTPWVGLFVIAASSLAAEACVGDDPTPTVRPDDDAGGGGGADASMSSGDAAQASDTSMAPSDGSPSDANEGGSSFDAGPPQWTATLGAGTQIDMQTAGDGLCTFQLIAIQAGAPPTYTIYLRKQDASAGTCAEPKGLRQLTIGYSSPTGALLVPQGAKRLVVAYSTKIGLSGSSPVMLTMNQVDWATGNDLRNAQMKTKAVMGIPMTPSLGVSQLFFGDQTEQNAGTIRLKGTGSFPGESGTGAFFNAMWIGFIGGVAQPAAAADTSVRSD